MHNLISYNQLAGWKESIKRLEKTLEVKKKIKFEIIKKNIRVLFSIYIS